MDELIEEWDVNTKIDIYKYFFDEEILDNEKKEEWALNFMSKAEERIKEMSLNDFSSFIKEKIGEDVDFERIKNILKRVRKMLKSNV